ncbi:hypothetical protein RI367_007846, partial [Sorochytrium milnesiophthora]
GRNIQEYVHEYQSRTVESAFNEAALVDMCRRSLDSRWAIPLARQQPPADSWEAFHHDILAAEYQIRAERQAYSQSNYQRTSAPAHRAPPPRYPDARPSAPHFHRGNNNNHRGNTQAAPQGHHYHGRPGQSSFAASSSSRPAPPSAPMDVDEHNVPPAKRPRYTREYHQQQVRNMDRKQRQDYARLHSLCKYCFSPDHFIAACPERPCTPPYKEPNRTPSPLPHVSEVIEVHDSSEESRYSSTEDSEENRHGPCLAPGYKNTMSPPRHAVSPKTRHPTPDRASSTVVAALLSRSFRDALA